MKKKLLVTAVILAVLTGALLAALVLGGDHFLKRPGAGDSYPPFEPATAAFEAVNPSGQKIAGFYYQGKPDVPVILLCHGHSTRHEQLGGVFGFLRKQGFPLLLLDFRAHGRSEGTFTSIGLQEWEDIAVILKKAEELGHLPVGRPLIAYGRSMGAAALANGAGRLPRIQAFILESMYPELRTIGGRDAESIGIPDSFLVDVFFGFSAWRTGIPYLDSKPSQEIVKIHPRPLLLIHDALDHRANTEDFHRLQGIASWASTLVIPGAKHVRGHQVAPELFEREFLAFIASAGFSLP